MTKQHLVAFASEIRNRFNLTSEASFKNLSPEQGDALIASIAIVCNVARQFNPRFDEARFRAACFAK